MIKKEDFPEELIEQIKHYSENGRHPFLNEELMNRELKRKRQIALDAINEYKIYKADCLEMGLEKDKYSNLLKKINEL